MKNNGKNNYNRVENKNIYIIFSGLKKKKKKIEKNHYI